MSTPDPAPATAAAHLPFAEADSGWCWEDGRRAPKPPSI